MEKQPTRPPGRPRWRGRLAPVWVIGFTLLLSTVPLAQSSSESSNPAVPDVLGREAEPLVEYQAVRRMHARSDRFNQEGWLDAWTEFDGRAFRYRILSERGSEYVLNKVLKAVLKREQELIAEGGDRAAFTEDNYVFSGVREDTDGRRYVSITPKRKDVVLVDGRMVLTPDGSDVARVEGRLAKNPSFWTSLVNVIRHFAKVDGVRVPVSTESIAKIKFAGQSRLDVSYEYASINRRPVSVAARRILASARSSSLPE